MHYRVSKLEKIQFPLNNLWVACLATINIILLFSELVSSMLELDPNQRPTLAQVMSHPWLAPHLYRLATTLGAISTSKVSDYFGYLQGPTFDNKAKKGYLRKKGCLPI